MFRDWSDMLAAFRALGGVAENLRQDISPFGRGLFPIDPVLPVRLHVPENLLFGAEAIVFEDDAIRVAASAGYGDAECRFFEDYQRAFSWRDGGADECRAFFAAMDALPPKLREALTGDFALGAMFKGSVIERTQKSFVGSRCIRYSGRRVMAPILELANHRANGPRYERGSGVGIAGIFPEEIRLGYRRLDPLFMFAGYHFASPEPLAFSLPLAVPLGARLLGIRRAFRERRVSEGGVALPLIRDEGRVLDLSFLLLGNRDVPAQPRQILMQLAREIDDPSLETCFAAVRRTNVERFEKLLAATASSSQPAIMLLHAVAGHQLAALAGCD